jgi:NTE family protein
MVEQLNGVTSGKENYVDLVCEGGGVKGIGLVGAISVLEEQGYQPQNVAGTSAGAIVATLLAAGYSAADLKEIILDLDFNRFKDPTWEMRIPLAGSLLSILKNQGLYKGDYFHGLMRHYLEAKGVHTFRDLVHPDPTDDPRYRYKVQVIASDVTGRQLLVLPRDAAQLGIDVDDLKVADAVRMSMSIPVFFTPVRVHNRKSAQTHLIVDGGMLANFPVWLFDSDGVPDWPTFGLKLVEPDPRTPISERLPSDGRAHGGIGAVVDFAKSLVATMTEFYDRLYLEKDTFVRTIPIPTLGISSTEFDLSRDQALQLYQAGRTAAEQFLETWNFAGYVAEFRKGKDHSRRAEVATEINQAAAVAQGSAKMAEPAPPEVVPG